MSYKNYKSIILILICMGMAAVLVSRLLGLALISVVSNSMKHENEELFFQFWEKRGYDAERVKEFPLSGGFQGGDMLILKRTDNYKIGDVVPYQAGCVCEEKNGQNKCKCSRIIIHRLVDLDEDQVFFFPDNIKDTKGKILVGEEIEKEFVLGKIIFKIPKLGLIKALLNCWGKRCDLGDCIVNGNCNN